MAEAVVVGEPPCDEGGYHESRYANERFLVDGENNNNRTPSGDSHVLDLAPPVEGWSRVTVVDRLGTRYVARPDRVYAMKGTQPAAARKQKVDNNEPRNPSRQLYVGISAQSFLPVYSDRRTKGTAFDYRDNFASVHFVTEPDRELAGAPTVILDERLLRAGALGFIKRLHMQEHDATADIPDDILNPKLSEQANNFAAGLPMAPILPGTLDQGPLRLDVIEGYKPGGSGRYQFFSLILPQLTKARLPSDLINMARHIHARLRYDNLNLHQVLMAMLVWASIERSPTHQLEGKFIDEHSGKTTPALKAKYVLPPLCSMIDFIALWPHYLRFHEVHRLPIYGHPLRFVDRMLRARGQMTPSKLLTTQYLINDDWETVAKTMIEVALNTHGMGSLAMLPSSWPGSQLVRPNDATQFATRGVEVALLTGQPDIRLHGLPHYPLHSNPFVDILIPSKFVSPRVERPLSQDYERVSSSVLSPRGCPWTRDDRGHPKKSSQPLMFILGNTLSAYQSPDLMEDIAEMLDQEMYAVGFEHPARVNLFSGLTYLNMVSETGRLAIAEANWDRYLLACRLDIPRDQVVMGHDGLFTWDGIEAQFLPQGELTPFQRRMLAISRDQPVPPPGLVDKGPLSDEQAGRLRQLVAARLGNSHPCFDPVIALADVPGPIAKPDARQILRQACVTASRQRAIIETAHRQISANFFKGTLGERPPYKQLDLIRGLSDRIIRPLFRLLGKTAAADANEDVSLDHCCRILEGCPAVAGLLRVLAGALQIDPDTGLLHDFSQMALAHNLAALLRLPETSYVLPFSELCDELEQPSES